MAERLRWKGPETFGGIDPGKRGFMVLWDGREVVRADPIPYLDKLVDEVRLLKILREWVLLNCVHVNLEYQQTFPREGVVAAFNHGVGYGVLRCAVASVGIRRSLPKPQQWKRDIGIPMTAKAKLPRLPKKPKGTNARKLAEWKIEYAAVDKKRKAIQRAKKTRLKDLAIQRAQELAPYYDFRISTRVTKPHDGKCEAFLLAHLSWQKNRRKR